MLFAKKETARNVNVQLRAAVLSSALAPVSVLTQTLAAPVAGLVAYWLVAYWSMSRDITDKLFNVFYQEICKKCECSIESSCAH